MIHRPGPSRKLPKQSSTIPVKGVGDDAGKWFRCWNCGFMCNVDRDKLSGDKSLSGVVLMEYVAIPDTYGDPLAAYACLDGCESFFHTTPKMKADGTPQEEKHTLAPSSELSSGCPQCHSLNWRGDF